MKYDACSIKRVADALRTRLAESNRQLRVVERASQQIDGNSIEAEIDYNNECEYLATTLRQLALATSLTLEALELLVLRQEFSTGFALLEDKLAKVEPYEEEPEILFSEPLIYIRRFIEILEPLITPEQAEELSVLERILRQTPHILHS